MDFKSFTAKLGEMSSKALETGVSALSKTTDFTYENIRKTPATLKTPADFEAVRTTKKLAVFVLGTEDAQTKNILLQLPILFSKAWIESVSIRIIAAAESPDLVGVLEAKTPSVLFYRDGERKFALDGEKLDAFVKSFDIRRDWSLPLDAPQSEPAKSIVEENTSVPNL